MHAIEFDAVVQAHAIPLPKPVALASGLPVRVVVMYEGAESLPAPNAEKSEDFSFDEAALLAQITHAPAVGTLSAAQLQTVGFRFDREEANER